MGEHQSKEQEDAQAKELEEIQEFNKDHAEQCKNITLSPDFFNFTVMCFYKDNIQKMKLDQKKLAKIVY